MSPHTGLCNQGGALNGALPRSKSLRPYGTGRRFVFRKFQVVLLIISSLNPL